MLCLSSSSSSAAAGRSKFSLSLSFSFSFSVGHDSNPIMMWAQQLLKKTKDYYLFAQWWWWTTRFPFHSPFSICCQLDSILLLPLPLLLLLLLLLQTNRFDDDRRLQYLVSGGGGELLARSIAIPSSMHSHRQFNYSSCRGSRVAVSLALTFSVSIAVRQQQHSPSWPHWISTTHWLHYTCCAICVFNYKQQLKEGKERDGELYLMQQQHLLLPLLTACR